MSVKSTEYSALDELASRVQADLHVLRFPHDPWVLPKAHLAVTMSTTLLSSGAAKAVGSRGRSLARTS